MTNFYFAKTDQKGSGKANDSIDFFNKSIHRFKYFVILLFAIIGQHTYATTYYLANNGNDTYNGTLETTPWKSISRLNNALSQFKAGDRVLFHCNDVFEGQIVIPSGCSGTLANPIVFGSYDSGSKPVISGSVNVSNWVQYATNIWKADVAFEQVTQVFEDNKRLTLARIPNNGYYRIKQVFGNTGFSDNTISQSTNYWKNSSLVFYLNEWHWTTVNIDSSTTDGYIRFSNKDSVFNPIYSQSGYYIQNKLELIDTTGEWFFDKTSKTLYMYSVNDPSNKNIRASVYENGIKTSWPWDNKNITIQDIEFRQQANEGLLLFGEKFTINQCLIQQTGLCGIYINLDWVGYSRNNTISHNQIVDCQNSGIATFHLAQSTIEHNSIRKCALKPALFNTTQFAGAQDGINLFNGDSLTIRHNRVDSVGGAGFSIETNYSLIEKNIIEYAMLLTSDGGALYNNNGKFNTFRNNIFRFTQGNMDASPPDAPRFTKELYFDMGDHRNNIIENNTMQSQRDNAGIGVAWVSDNITIRNNVVYGGLRGLEILNYDPINKPVTNLKISNNTFYTNRKNAYPYWINTWNGFPSMYNTCDSNYLCNPFSDKIVENYNGPNIYHLNFKDWKASSKVDIHSQLSYAHWDYPTDNSFILVNETDSTIKYYFNNAVRDLDNKPVESTILAPYSSRVFIGNKSIDSSEVYTRIQSLLSKNKFKIYPNPANEQLMIEIDGQFYNDINVEFYNLSSCLIKKERLKSNCMDVSGLNPGVYIIKIIDNKNNLVYIDKLIKI